jgi:hypothetical protein
LNVAKKKRNFNIGE